MKSSAQRAGSDDPIPDPPPKRENLPPNPHVAPETVP